MTDLEMTALCAKALGYRYKVMLDLWVHIYNEDESAGHHWAERFEPLTNDAQLMALEDWLIERGHLEFDIDVARFSVNGVVVAASMCRQKETRRYFIVETVATMMQPDQQMTITSSSP